MQKNLTEGAVTKNDFIIFSAYDCWELNCSSFIILQIP